MQRSSIAIHLTLAATLFITGIVDAQSDTWKQKKSLGTTPPGAFGGVTFNINNKVYTVAGSQNSNTLKETWEFNPVTNSWLQKAIFPGPGREFPFAFSIGNKGYLGAGQNYDSGYHALSDFWEYDAVADKWTRKADISGAIVGAGGFSIGGKGYLVGGFSLFDNQPLHQLIEYNPETDIWSRKGDFPGRSGWLAFSVGDRAYVGTRDFYEYDAIADQWSRKADYPGLVGANHGFSIGSKIFLVKASSEDASPKETWQYDTEVNQWSKQSDFPGANTNGAFNFSAIGKGYIAGKGQQGFFGVNNIWVFDTASGIWSINGSLENKKRAAAIAFSIGDKGYAGLGYDLGAINKKDFWEYDPVADSWSQKADFGGMARSDAISFVIGGKAYVGLGNDTTSKSDIWLYDAGANAWIRKADFPGKSHWQGLSIGSKGYVVGNELWQYDPVSDSWNQKMNYPGSEALSFAFAVGDKGYVGSIYGERDLMIPGLSLKTEVWQFDSEGNWLRKSDFPGYAATGSATFTIADKGYVSTGFNPGYIFPRDLWQYIPATDKWFKKAGFPGYGRNDASGFSIGNKGYLLFGTLFVAYYNDVWEYTAADNEPPVAAGFIMKNYYPNGHLLNAWGSYDPEGGPVKFLWKKTGGPSQYKMLYENSSTPVVSDLVTGTYTFQLTVTDQEGAIATTDVTVSVVNHPPVADAFVMMYYYPNAHLLNAWGSYDPDGGPVTFWWTKISGPASYQMLHPEASTLVISNLAVGNYSFQLKVTDNEGATAYDTVEVVNSMALSQTNDNGTMLSQQVQGSINSNKLIISPNPVYDRLNLKWNSEYLGAANLTIMDMSGRAVKVTNINKERKEFVTSLPLDGVKPGNYYLFIRLQNGRLISSQNGRLISSKFIKQ